MILSFPAVYIPIPDFNHMYAFMHSHKIVNMGLSLKVQMTQFALLCMQPKPVHVRLALLFFKPGYIRSIFESI